MHTIWVGQRRAYEPGLISFPLFSNAIWAQAAGTIMPLPSPNPGNVVRNDAFTTMKHKVRILLPLAIVTAMLIYCWVTLLTTDLTALWRHYVGIILYVPTVFAIFRSLRLATWTIGIYLLLATFNVLAFSPSIKTSWLILGSVSTPPVQLFSLGLLIFYLILNFNAMIEYYLDYKEVNRLQSINPSQTRLTSACAQFGV